MMHYVCIYMYHCCDSARGNGFKLQSATGLDIRNKCFTKGVRRCCCRLPREVMQTHRVRLDRALGT